MWSGSHVFRKLKEVTTKRKPKRIPHPRIVAPEAPFTTVDQAIAEIAKGRMIIVVDDEDRENEGDLTMAAEAITPEAVAFIRKYASGVICVPMRLRSVSRRGGCGPTSCSALISSQAFRPRRRRCLRARSIWSTTAG